MVGNDIVDFQFFEAPLYRHIRYLERVCLPAEAQAVRRSEYPARNLGLIWACKEAAFKLVSSEWNLRHFLPRKFLTDFGGSEPRFSHVVRRVAYGGARINVQLSVQDEWAHAVATFPGHVTTRWRVREIEKSSTGRSAAKMESETVRLIARELLQELDFKNVFRADNEGAPRLAEESLVARPGVSVSFSHHGSYAAAALAWISSADGQPSFGCELGEECSTCIA